VSGPQPGPAARSSAPALDPAFLYVTGLHQTLTFTLLRTELIARPEAAERFRQELLGTDVGTWQEVVRIKGVGGQVVFPMITVRRVLGLSTAGLLLLVVVSLGFLARSLIHNAAQPSASRASTTTAIPQRYIAIVPFTAVGDSAVLDPIAEGLLARLTASLSRMKGIRVVQAEAAPSMILRGHLQGNMDALHIALRLEDTARGRVLWSQEFSGAVLDFPAVESRISAELTAALGSASGANEVSFAGRSPANGEAQAVYLQARRAAGGQPGLAKLETAARLYEQAVENDPGLALAYAELADTRLRIFKETNDRSQLEKALAAARQAAQRADELPETHISLAGVYKAYGDMQAAVAELKRAVQLAPDSDSASRQLGEMYLAIGRSYEALIAMEKAARVNPYSWANLAALGDAHVAVGNMQKALEAYYRAIELDPKNPASYAKFEAVYSQQREPKYGNFAFLSVLGTTVLQAGRYAEAAQLFERAAEMNPREEVVLGNLADAYRWDGEIAKARVTYDKAIVLAWEKLRAGPHNAEVLGRLAVYYAKKGDAKQAEELIRRGRSVDRGNAAFAYSEAVVHVLAGRSEEALRVLREALGKGASPERAWSDLEFRALRSRPEFKDLVNGFGQGAS